MSKPVAPTLVFAVGNLSRGDDAVGPLLAERLIAAEVPGVEVLVDFQLQVEHALDLEQRARVIFIDACVDVGTSADPGDGSGMGPGQDLRGGPGFVVRPVHADAKFATTSHALAPAQVLETFVRVTGRVPPPSLLLGIHGECFDLGAGLSPAAAAACAAAWPRLLELCGAVSAVAQASDRSSCACCVPLE